MLTFAFSTWVVSGVESLIFCGFVYRVLSRLTSRQPFVLTQSTTYAHSVLASNTVVKHANTGVQIIELNRISYAIGLFTHCYLQEKPGTLRTYSKREAVLQNVPVHENIFLWIW